MDNELVPDSRRCTGGGLFAGRGGESSSSASVVEFVGTFLAGVGGGFGLGVGEPPNLGEAINEAAAAATRPGPLGIFSSS